MGIVPSHGHQLPGDHTFLDIAVCGPMARSAGDLAVVLTALAGPHGDDAPGWRLELPAPRQKSLADFKVGVMLESPVCRQDTELTDQLQATVDALAKARVQVIDAAARTETGRTWITSVR